MDSLRGHLLIAGSGLFDPNFRRTVVLVGEHNEEGALGVVLNRPTEVVVSEAVPPLAAIVGPEESLFIGGPVQPQSPVVLAEFDQPDRAGLVVFGSIGFLVGDAPPDAVDGVVRARVFAGYAGWGPGQLESELERDDWIVVDAEAADAFADDPERLWARVLARKGGEYALLATMPPDPSLN